MSNQHHDNKGRFSQSSSGRMSFAQAKALKEQLEASVQKSGNAMKAFPTQGPMNLTPDDVKMSATYRQAKAKYNEAFQALRNFNERYTKTYKEEIQAERAARFK